MAEITPTARPSRILTFYTRIALVAALTLYFARAYVVRVFLAATGFVPFDLQYPLRPPTIAIQLGAYASPGVERLYSAFALVDALFAVAAAAAVALSWLWLSARAPNGLFDFLRRGGILLLPMVAGVLDIIENVGFHRLIEGLKGQSYADTIQWTATLHQVRAALIYIRDYLTLIFVGVTLILLWLRRDARPSR